MRAPKGIFLLLVFLILSAVDQAAGQITTITTTGTGTGTGTTQTGISTVTTSVTSTISTSTVTTGITTDTETISITGTTTTDVSGALRAEAPSAGAILIASLLALCAMLI